MMDRNGRFTSAGQDGSIWSSVFDARAGYQPILSLRWQKDIKALLRKVKRSELIQDRIVATLTAYVEQVPTNTARLAQLVGRPGVLDLLNEMDPYDEVPEDGSLDGPMKLGMCKGSTARFALFPRELMQGTLVIGRPGAGKTTLGGKMIEQSVLNGFTCIVLDVKRDYRSFLRKPMKTVVIGPENLEPLLVPDGVSPERYSAMFVDVICDSLGVQEGTKSYLLEHLERLYQRRKKPALQELYDAVKQDKPARFSRTENYQDSAKNRLYAMLVRARSNGTSRKVWRLERLLEAFDVVVIELDGLDLAGRVCYAALTIGSISEHRIQNGLRGGKGKPLHLLVDESNDIFVKKFEQQRGRTRLTSYVRQAREFDIAGTYFGHLPAELCDDLKNVHSRFLLSESEGFNLKQMAESMGLSPEERDANFALEKGQAIVRIASRYYKPFVIQGFPCQLDKDIPDEEVKRRMEPFMAKFTEELSVPGPVEIDAEIEVRDAGAGNGTAGPNGNGNGMKNAKEGLPVKLRTFLTDILNHPFKCVTARYDELKLSSSDGDSRKDQILRRGLCESLAITTGGQGSSAKYLALTGAGFAALGVEPNHKLNPSNFRHSFWQDRIAKWATRSLR